MQRFYKFIVVCLLLAANCLTVRAQKGQVAPVLKRTLINGKTIEYSWLRSAPIRVHKPGVIASLEAPKKYLPVGSDFYVKSLGFFCQVEYRVEKKLNVPLRIRIGALDYLNQLEGKK